MALTMELDEFVSGERLQNIANISVIPIGNGIGESECDFVKVQQQNNNYKTFYYNENTDSIPDYVLNAKIIFVNTWTLNKFFSILFPKLTNKHVFISHNSDICFDNTFLHFLDDDKVIKWFSQNATATHKKLFALPIGLGNQQYPHGDLQLLKSIIDKNIKKDILVFKNFNIHTNEKERVICEHITSRNGISMFIHQNQSQYFEYIARSKFVISPPGNGPDCHRVWECFYLNTIPIILKSSAFEQFNDLPILFIDSWEQLTIPWLKEQFKSITKFDFNNEKLRLSNWKKFIEIV